MSPHLIEPIDEQEPLAVGRPTHMHYDKATHQNGSDILSCCNTGRSNLGHMLIFVHV